jgi:hypothetical protein
MYVCINYFSTGNPLAAMGLDAFTFAALPVCGLA